MEDDRRLGPLRSYIVDLQSLCGQSRPFLIPPYQRAYSWQDEEVGRLFQDLRNAYDRQSECYFLGTVVLIVDTADGADVVDGQQRLATLSLLAAALRDRLAAVLQAEAEILKVLQAVLSGPAGARLWLRRSDHAFWQSYVESPGRIADLCALEGGRRRAQPGEIDPQPLMVRAAQTLSAAIDQAEGLDLEAFARHVLRAAQFNVIETTDRAGAPHMFTVLNNTGLDLSAADLVKSELLIRAKVSEEEANRLATLWEEKVDLIGRRGMNELFSALPFLLNPAGKSAVSDTRDWSEALMQVPDPKRFLEEDIHRYVRAYWTFVEANAEYGNYSKEINRRLRCLSYVEDRAWLPAVLWVLSDPAASQDASFVRDYLQGVERFAYACHAAAVPSGSRPGRLRAILNAGRNRLALFGLDGALVLRDKEEQDLLSKLCTPSTRNHKRRRIAVFRMNAALGEALDITRDDATVEHLLPLNAKGEWLQWYPEGELRGKMADWIGNLTLITTRQNEAAADKNFGRKKPTIFDEVSPVRALSRDLRELSRFGPEELRARHNRLRKVLADDLGISDPQPRL